MQNIQQKCNIYNNITIQCIQKSTTIKTLKINKLQRTTRNYTILFTKQYKLLQKYRKTTAYINTNQYQKIYTKVQIIYKNNNKNIQHKYTINTHKIFNIQQFTIEVYENIPKCKNIQQKYTKTYK